MAQVVIEFSTDNDMFGDGDRVDRDAGIMIVLRQLTENLGQYNESLDDGVILTDVNGNIIGRADLMGK